MTGAGWITVGGALFIVSGIVWISFLVRYQDKMSRLSENTTEGKESNEFSRVLHGWYFWGALATVIPIAATILMAIKPSL